MGFKVYCSYLCPLIISPPSEKLRNLRAYNFLPFREEEYATFMEAHKCQRIGEEKNQMYSLRNCPTKGDISAPKLWKIGKFSYIHNSY